MKHTRLHPLILSLSAASALFLARPAQAQVSVAAQYFDDNTSFVITNNFATPLSGITIKGKGYGGNSVSGTVTIPTIAPGKSYVFAFDDSSSAFTSDFDDTWFGQASYTLKGTVDGRLISLTFSPDNNTTGGFVPFLGNDKLGFEYGAEFQAIDVSPKIVFPRETLQGGGVVPGSLFNLGTVNPGHNDPLIVHGDFVQWTTGDLVIELKSKHKYGQVYATGVAIPYGRVTFKAVGGFLPEAGQKFTFLSAHDGVLGAFDTLNDRSGAAGTILGLDLIYGPNSVTLEYTQGSFEDFAAGQHLSRNQYAVAEALDKSVAAGKTGDLIRFLDHEQLGNLPAEFDRISPEELTSIFTIGVAYAQVQSLNLQRRTDDIRSGSNGFSAGGLAINGNGPSFSGGLGITTGVAGPSGSDGKESKEVKSIVPAESRWGAFLSGTGEWVNVSGTDNARGYALSSGGFTLGVDYKVTPNLAIGLAAGYTGTTADLTDRGRVWVNGGKIGLYGTFYQNEQVAQAPTMSKDSSKDSKEVQAPVASIAKGFYADVAVFGGYNSYDTRRASVNGEARGDTDGGELNVLFGTGYDFKKGALTFGPTATFNYTYVGLNGFTEHNSLAPLNIHGGDGESLRSAFGFKASYDWKVGGLAIKPELRAAWQHEFADSTYALDSNFANGAASTFTVRGPRFGRDSLLVGAGFAIQCNERCATYLYYNGELLRENYISNAVTGGVRVSF